MCLQLTKNTKCYLFLKTCAKHVGRCVFAKMFFRGDLTVAGKLGVFVKTPVFCLCCAHITGPSQKGLES